MKHPADLVGKILLSFNQENMSYRAMRIRVRYSHIVTHYTIPGAVASKCAPVEFYGHRLIRSHIQNVEPLLSEAYIS